MNKLWLLCVGFALFMSDISSAQVARTVVVEHFTNTRCGICNSRNPGFYSNLNSQDNVLHLAIHPSSPYSSCLFSQHNPSQNDARTNYYGVYGGTPRLVIQGEVISAGANYADASIFDDYIGQTSPASISMQQAKYGNDSMRLNVIVKTEAAHSLGDLRLFIALAEDEVAYNAPNGEDEHYDVFRESLTAADGWELNLPAAVGDSLVFSATVTPHADWDFERIFALAILQEAGTKAVVQSAASTPDLDNFPEETSVGIFDATPTVALTLYPNPVNEQLTIELPTAITSTATLFDTAGKVVFEGTFNGRLTINTAALLRGQYLLQVENVQGSVVERVLKW